MDLSCPYINKESGEYGCISPSRKEGDENTCCCSNYRGCFFFPEKEKKIIINSEKSSSLEGKSSGN